MIQYVTGEKRQGRRIMPPKERDKLAANEDHTCDRAIGGGEEVYAAGEFANDKGLVEVADDQVTIVFTRFWSYPRWTFVTEARNVFGDVLTTTTCETFREAQEILEDDLRAQRLIS